MSPPRSSEAPTAGAAAAAALVLVATCGRPEAECQQIRRDPADGTRVFMWGERAALPADEAGDDPRKADARSSPTEVAWFRRHAERHKCLWRQLAFGPSFGVARSSGNELFVWGSCKSKDGKSRTYLEPRALLFDEIGTSGRFVDVQCSETAAWALTVDGEVIVWERVPSMLQEKASTSSAPDSDTGPQFLRGGKRITGMDRPVRQMAIGASHAAFVTDDGDCYCLGSNRCGECGADPAKQGSASACRLIKFPRHVNPVVRVSCGRSHTVVIGGEGQVLAWGDDSKIQLGLGDTRSNVGDERPWEGSRGFLRHQQTGESMAAAPVLRHGPEGAGTPRRKSTSSARYGEFEAHIQWSPAFCQEIPLEFERQVHGIPYPPPDGLVCGDDFTVLMVRDSPDWFAPEEESNRLFCCGDNGRGQCGRSLQTSQQIFSATKLPRNSYTQTLSCGSNHCAAVLQRVGHRTRELWLWGNNQRGQVATGSTAVVCPAARLKLAKGVRVEAAFCGFAASGAICTELPPKAPRATTVGEQASPASAANTASPDSGEGDEEEEEWQGGL